MTNVPTGAAQYLVRFADQHVACSQYALTRLGVDRSRCFLKIDEYMILCAPFQFGFKRSIFLASLSKQELTFFQRFTNGIIGLSMEFVSPNRQEPLKLFIRCTLSAVGQMKGRENVGLLVVDFKNTPDDFVVILGSHLEHVDRLKTQFEDYGKTNIRVTPDTAKLLGYNMYATITEVNGPGRRIQVFSINAQSIEHLEGAGAELRPEGTAVAYQLFFRRYRVSVAGTIVSSERLPTGIIKTQSKLEFSPELVEILDDYWFRNRAQKNQPN
jgi:hypothetical protein